MMVHSIRERTHLAIAWRNDEVSSCSGLVFFNFALLDQLIQYSTGIRWWSATEELNLIPVLSFLEELCRPRDYSLLEKESVSLDSTEKHRVTPWERKTEQPGHGGRTHDFKAGRWRPMVPRVPRVPRVSRKEPALAFSAHVRLHFLDPCYLTLVFFTLHWDGGWSLPEAMKVHERISFDLEEIDTYHKGTRSSRGGHHANPQTKERLYLQKRSSLPCSSSPTDHHGGAVSNLSTIRRAYCPLAACPRRPTVPVHHKSERADDITTRQLF